MTWMGPIEVVPKIEREKREKRRSSLYRDRKLTTHKTVGGKGKIAKLHKK